MENKNIAKKLIAVMAAVPYIQKDGTNQVQKYNYVSEAHIVAVIREELIKHCVTVTPSLKSMTVIEAGQTSSGAIKYLTTIEMEYTFTDGDSGESFVAVFPGQGIDAGDKGVYKAMAGAHKYALLKTFNISTGDDDPENEPKKESKKRQSSTAPAPNRDSRPPVQPPRPKQSPPAAAKDVTLAERMRAFAGWSETDFVAEIVRMEKYLYGDDMKLTVNERKASGVLSVTEDLTRATKRELFFYYEKLILNFMRAKITKELNDNMERIALDPKHPRHAPKLPRGLSRRTIRATLHRSRLLMRKQ